MTSDSVTWRNYARLGYTRATRGVYVPPEPEDTTELDPREARRHRFLTLVHAVMTAYRGRDIALFGVTALQVMGVALPESLEDWEHCHVLVPRGSYRPKRRDVVSHWTTTPFHSGIIVDGLPVLHPVDHWLQIRGSDDDLVEIGDGLVRRRHPLISMNGFRRRLNALAGAPGAQAARRAFQLVRPGTDSLYETRTRLLLVRAGLPTPSVNPLVHTRNGTTYHVDMAYEREKLAVEYDGAYHVGETRQMNIDAQRRLDLQDAGWLIITVTAPMLHDPEPLIRSVEEALILRRAALGRHHGDETPAPRPMREAMVPNFGFRDA